MDREDRWTEGGPSPAHSQSLWTKPEDGCLAESHFCCRAWSPAPPAWPPRTQQLLGAVRRAQRSRLALLQGTFRALGGPKACHSPLGLLCSHD